jgi:hypothetical protein
VREDCDNDECRRNLQAGGENEWHDGTRPSSRWQRWDWRSEVDDMEHPNRSGKPNTVDASASEQCATPLMACSCQIRRENFPVTPKNPRRSTDVRTVRQYLLGDVATADPLAHSLRRRQTTISHDHR